MIKKLRYYARFIVVCLLLNRKDTGRLLLEELNGHVKDYNMVYKPADLQEWDLVLQEISVFLDAEKSIVPVDYEGIVVSCNARMKAESSSFVAKNTAAVRIQEAVIVGNNLNQASRETDNENWIQIFWTLWCLID